MARPRKPTSILELNGAFRHDPNRARPNEPRDVRALGNVPSRLPADVVPFWLELAAMVIGGVLTFRDRWAVELAARLMEKAVRETPDPEEKITSSELSTLRSLLAALGMTPADRSKLSVPTEKAKNPFTDLAQEARAPRPN